jgi:TonB family protein
MDQLEQALSMAFRRESPPAGFAQRVELLLTSRTAIAGNASRPSPFRPRVIAAGKPSIRARVSAVATRLFFIEPPSVAVPFQGLAPVRSSPASIAFSAGAHAAVIALIAFFVWSARLHVRGLAPAQTTALELKPWLPLTQHQKLTMGGGGGGGDHEVVQASKGKLPRFAREQIASPRIVRNDNPKLAVEPTIVMPRNIQLRDAEMPNLGLPTSTQVRMASNGTGANAGMGSGHNGGLGSGDGSGLGPGTAGGTGGGVYHVGGGVSAPTVLSAVDPEYSDEGRRAKYTGIVVVALVVDAQGSPQNVHVVRHLGMGLDEKAVEAVRQYKFKPAEYQGRPVPVEVNIEVNFRIY